MDPFLSLIIFAGMILSSVIDIHQRCSLLLSSRNLAVAITKDALRILNNLNPIKTFKMILLSCFQDLSELEVPPANIFK
jgi:hypothetical protein